MRYSILLALGTLLVASCGNSDSSPTLTRVGLEREDPALGALGEELASGITTAVEGAVSAWRAGGSPEEIAAARADWEALREITTEELDAAWRVDVDGGGRPAREVLAEVLATTRVVLREGTHGSALDTRVELELEGVSRAEALDAVCSAVGLVPVFEDQTSAWNDEPETLTLATGPRRLPIHFVGPFAVEAAVAETAPHTTGELTVTMWALGLGGSMCAANADMATFLDVSGIRSPDGTSLHAEEGTTYMGAPTIADGLFRYSIDVDLRGLLRGVREIAAIEGDLALTFPREVNELRFEGPGTRAADRWTVTCKELTASSSFEIAHDSGDAESTAARFAPDDASGRPLGIVYQGVSSWGAEARADLDTPEAPAAVGVKVFRAERVSYAFRLEHLPLRRFAEQPERLAPLEFDGAAPIAARFREFTDRSQPDFPRIAIDVLSLANKDATGAQATFRYLDAKGALLKEHPHTLSAPISFEAPVPLVAAGATTEQDVVAFFMPASTHTVDVRVDRVSFVDGTTWARPAD